MACNLQQLVGGQVARSTNASRMPEEVMVRYGDARQRDGGQTGTGWPRATGCIGDEEAPAIRGTVRKLLGTVTSG
jgi:hypothetical protein